MSGTRPCASPIADETLLDYWMALLDEASEADLEEHLFRCDACGHRLATTIAFADGLRDVARSGSLRVIVSDDFLRRATREGRTVREVHTAEWRLRGVHGVGR